MKIKRVRHLTGTTAEWEAASSSVLLKGEIGFEDCGNGVFKMKIGDGVSTWANLKYTIYDPFRQYVRFGLTEGILIELTPSRWEDCGKSYDELFDGLSAEDLYDLFHEVWQFKDMTAQEIYDYFHAPAGGM